MNNLLHDIRYGLRMLAKNPGFTAVAVLTLALGIGANTAIFTLVDAVMLRSLPVAKPQQLYRIGNNNNCCVIGNLQDNWGIFSYPLYQQFREHTPEFSEMAAFQAGLQNMSVRRSGSTGAAEPYVGEFVSGNYFSTFGISAFAGRTITPQDDKPNAAPVAVMSYRTWSQRFGLDPSVIGATLTFDNVPYTVAGIAPPGFFGDTLRPDPPDFWLPLSSELLLDGKEGLLNRPGSHWLYIMGRLKPGANPASVQSEVTVALQQWLSIQPEFSASDRSEFNKQHTVLVPAGGGVASLQSNYKTGLRLLMTIAGFVLLIACANIANLLLARGVASRTETAIRAALGAPRPRLIRQALTESVLLAVFGGLAGIVVAFFGTRTILALAFRGASVVPISPTPSLTVLGFAFLLSLITGIVFGVAPAWMTTHSDPAEALRGAGRSTRDRSSLPRKALVVVQVALSALLLIGAGLLTQSLRNLEKQSFGFDPQGRLIVRVYPTFTGYAPEKLAGLYQELDRRLPQIPGVLSASYSLYSPMRGDNWSMWISVEGHPPDKNASPSFDRVGPHYFETIGTRLLRGRVIGVEDTPTSRQVAVINETFARMFFPKEDPIGKRFGIGDVSHSGDFEIVGIVQDAKYQNAREPAYPTYFLPFLQMSKDPKQTWLIISHYLGDIELRVADGSQSYEAPIRRTLADIDPNLTVLYVVSMPEQISRNFNQERLIARLTQLFGLLALTLACVGLYGVIAYSVARRTNEIGIRMALGALPRDVLRMILGQGMRLTAIGVGLGLVGGFALTRFLASTLYGVRPLDPLAFLAGAFALTTAALLAAYLPARRATKVDPMVALRYE